MRKNDIVMPFSKTDHVGIFKGHEAIVKKPTTKGEARQYGIDYQNWASENNLSYGEVLFFQNELIKIAKKFRLVKEFKENGII